MAGDTIQNVATGGIYGLAKKNKFSLGDVFDTVASGGGNLIGKAAGVPGGAGDIISRTAKSGSPLQVASPLTPAAAPTPDDPATAKKLNDEQLMQQRARGRSSTIFAGNLKDGISGNIFKRSLLGN